MRATVKKETKHMSTMSIEKVEVPHIDRPGRAKTPNPFLETVKSLKLTTKDEKGEAAAVRVFHADVPRAVRKMQEAGREAGCSVRTLVQDAGATHKKIIFWPVPAIKRTTEETEEAEANAKSATKTANAKPKK